jgi:hypothetical protein
VLKPVAVYPDSTRKNGVLVMCEVMMPDGTPHPSNSRATILDDPGAWFGFEQEYFFYKDGRPLGFPENGYPAPQGPYYTGVGYKNVGDVAREIVEEHLDLCLDAGINHEGINAEVAKGQWEFQIFGKGSKKLPPTRCGSPATSCPPVREVRHRHRVPLQADPRRHRLERLGHARQLLDQAHARSRRQGLLREAHGRSTRTWTNTSPSTARTTTCASPACTRRSRSTSSPTGWPTAAPRSASRTASSTTATRATWKTAARILSLHANTKKPRLAARLGKAGAVSGRTGLL